MRPPAAIVEANARLTAYSGLLLLVLLAAEGVTVLRIRAFLVPHALIGFALIPPVLLKLASVGNRFARYYLGDPRYRAAGPPSLGMRLLGPLVVVLTVAVIATGVELWLFGGRFGYGWVSLHKASFVLWFFAMAIHVLAYTPRAAALAASDFRDRLAGALTRRSLTFASLLVGLALAVAMAGFQTPFIALPDSG